MTHSEAVTYVTGLYKTYLGRVPDSAGLDYWVTGLTNNQISPASATAAISHSPEAIYYSASLSTAVEESYWNELGRLADSGGLAYWIDRLRSGATIESIRSTLHGTQEAIDFRTRLSQLPHPDPRLAAMQQFSMDGNAVIDYREGDRLDTLSEKAYGSKDYWWVIGQANNAVVDRELFGKRKIIIPDIRRVQNGNSVWLEDNGSGILYANRITGEQWVEYYTPVVSQQEPLEFEDNPNWLTGLAFVNGNDTVSVAANWAARRRPYAPLPASYWDAVKTGQEVAPISTNLPQDIDLSYINSLPIVNSTSPEGMPPPPSIRVAPGADSQKAIQEINKLPQLVVDTLRLARVEVVAVKESIVEVFPELRGRQIPGWPLKKTWDVAPGIFDRRTNRLGIATNPKPGASSSEDVFKHEAGHAFDFSMGDISNSPMFKDAFLKDYDALKAADTIDYYYSAPDRSDPNPENRTYVRAQSEAYAESFARYYSGQLSWFRDKPNLLKYFRNLPRPMQPGGR